MEEYDVTIIGAGVVGCAVARELARFRLRILVLEKAMDVATGNSSRNTGMLHAGFTYQPGSLKAICAVEGNQEFDQVAQELDVPFKRTGKLVIGFTDQDRENILKYKAIGEANGVRGMRMLTRSEMDAIDPHAGGNFAMHVPASGILDPMQYTIALAENACQNGVDFRFQSRVEKITREGEGYRIGIAPRSDEGDGSTGQAQGSSTGASQGLSEVFSKWVINCAGMYASQISQMLGYPNYPVRGFKGEYFVLDKRAGLHMPIPIYPAPNEKGGFSTHATPTVDGNVLVGPDSYLTEGLEDYKTTKDHLDGLIRDGSKIFSEMKREYFIRNFAGIRWKILDPETGENKDFVLEADDHHPHTVNLVGIESPGITCALPLARRVATILREKEDPEENSSFNPHRQGIRHFSEMPLEEKRRAVLENPDYGEIVCRCETVTRAEILAAIHNPLGVHTITGIKNRTRATMGRCQGGYCQMRITQMIQEELGLSEREVRYSRPGSYLFTGKVR